MRLFLLILLIIYSEEFDQHSNDVLQEVSMPKSSNDILSSMKCTESRRCGCYNGKCWSYIDDQQRPKTGWWCFTQREGIKTKEKAWATCTDSDQCSWTMTCGDCYTYVGKGQEIKTNKLIC